MINLVSKQIKNFVRNNRLVYVYFTLVNRIIKSFTYDRELFLSHLNKQNVFNEIYHNNYWGSGESKSGGGSTLEGTKIIRQELPNIILKYDIKSILDIPCGDFNWIKHVDFKCNYIGADLVSELVDYNNRNYQNEYRRFEVLDSTVSVLPRVDLIFCKDLLQHLSYASVLNALHNFKKSGSKYLLVTSYPYTIRNYDIHDGDFRCLNLFIYPFNLKNPLDKIHEYTRYHIEGVEVDKTMYLIDLHNATI